MHRITVARYLKGKDFTCRREGLIKDGLIKILTGKRKADQCYLTFKGLLYALNLGVIKAAEAAEVRQAHMAEPPPMPTSELVKLCSWALPDPEFIERTITKLKKRLLGKDFFKIERLTHETVEKIRVILDKYQRRESLLIQFLEKQHSEQIYGTLLRSVNILYYDPIITGHYYHNLIFWVFNRFILDVLMYRNKQAIIKLIDILKKDYVTFELLKEAWLPYYIEFPRMPEKLRRFFNLLKNVPGEEMCKLLERKLLSSTL